MRTLPRLRALEILHLSDEGGGPSTVLRDPEGYTDEELALSDAALFVAAHFDGEHTVDAVRDAFERRFGRRPGEAEIGELEARLDGAGFLEGPAFEARRRAMAGAFLAEPVRLPAHAGAAYPKDPAEAGRAVAEFFEAAQAIAEPCANPPGPLRGLVVPHIDLRAGGACAATGYRLLAREPGIGTVIVLGTSHACPHAAWIVDDRPFATPLGEVPVNEALCRRLAGAAPAPDTLRYYHRREHSVEFQALFLAALRRTGRELRMVPVLCGSIRDLDPDAADPFLGVLAGLADEFAGDLLFVAAADLAHVGPRFGDPEALSERHRAALEVRDRATLERVTSGDPAGFFRSVMEAGDPRRICGLAPIYALLSALSGAGGRVLRYEQANDPTGTVSYASVGLWGGR